MTTYEETQIKTSIESMLIGQYELYVTKMELLEAKPKAFDDWVCDEWLTEDWS